MGLAMIRFQFMIAGPQVEHLSLGKMQGLLVHLEIVMMEFVARV
jgi:hypothetical protein